MAALAREEQPVPNLFREPKQSENNFFPVPFYFHVTKQHQNPLAMMTSLNGLPYITFPFDSTWDDKISILEKALPDHPEDELKILKAMLPLTSVVESREELRLRIADRVLQLSTDPADRAEAMIARADVLHAQGKDLEEVIALYTEAQRLDPEFDDPYERLFKIHTERKEHDKALHWARLMAEQENSDHIGLPMVGRALIELERIPEAIAAFEACLREHPTSVDAHFGLANCHLLQERFAEASEAFIRTFETCHYPEPLYAYGAGYAYQQNDDPYRAMKWYAKALDIEPAYPNALNNMAVINLELSNTWDEALPYLLQAVELSNSATTPEMHIVYRNLWAYHTQILDHEKAHYYHRLMMNCLGFDDDTIDFMDSLLDG
jgi:tetratricopeptide (TPR) repeat protein